jgi:hypothetical protein
MRWLRRLWRRFVRSRLHGRRRLAAFDDTLHKKQHGLDRYFFDYVSGARLVGSGLTEMHRRSMCSLHRARHAVMSQRLYRTRRRFERLDPPPTERG